MKKVGKSVFFIILVLVLAFTALSIFGIHTMYGDIKTSKIKGIENIRWGMDLADSAQVTYAPPEEYFNPSLEELTKARDILEKRLFSNGFSNNEVYADTENNQIIVRFPWDESRSTTELEQLTEELGRIQFLTFREGVEVDQTTGAATGKTAEVFLLDSTHVTKARPSTDTAGNNVVDVTLNKEGKEILAAETTRLLGGQVSFWIDDQLLSMMEINEVLSGGSFYVPGAPNQQIAKNIADLLDAGPLPFLLQAEHTEIISSQFPTNLRINLIRIALIVSLLVAVFFVIRYRVGGVVAVISLIGQCSILIAATTGFLSTLNGPFFTIAGMVGFFLAMVIGVCSNLLIYEKLKHELSLGKSVDGAIKTGLSESFRPIFDISIVLGIVSVVIVTIFKGGLFGFGQALLVGMLGNLLFTGFVNRYMLRSLSQNMSLRKPWFYGGEKE